MEAIWSFFAGVIIIYLLWEIKKDLIDLVLITRQNYEKLCEIKTEIIQSQMNSVSKDRFDIGNLENKLDKIIDKLSNIETNTDL